MAIVDAADAPCGNAPRGTHAVAVIDLRKLTSCDYTLGPGAYRAAVSMDGAMIATISRDGVLMLWDTQSLAVRKAVPLNVAGDASDVAFNPDASRVAVSTRGGRTVVIDTKSGLQEIPPLADYRGAGFGGLVWSPDGKTLAVQATPDHDRDPSAAPVRTDLWIVDSRSWSIEMCSLAGRDITRDEWAQFVASSVPLQYKPLCPGSGS